MTQVIDAPVAAPEPVAIDPRILERREGVARQRTRRRLRMAAVVGAVVVVAAGAWAALHSPVLAARHVTVIGAVHTGVGPSWPSSARAGRRSSMSTPVVRPPGWRLCRGWRMPP